MGFCDTYKHINSLGYKINNYAHANTKVIYSTYQEVCHFWFAIFCYIPAVGILL